LLIRIIEENELEKFDKVSSQRSAVSSQRSAGKDQDPAIASGPPEVFEIAGRGGNDRVIFVNNGVKFILAREHDSFYSIAAEFNIYTWQVYAYNDLSQQDSLIAGQKVYLEKKKRKGEYDSHIVKAGEDLYSISQDYGIRLKALYKINQKLQGDKLTRGEKIILK